MQLTRWQKSIFALKILRRGELVFLMLFLFAKLNLFLKILALNHQRLIKKTIPVKLFSIGLIALYKNQTKALVRLPLWSRKLLSRRVNKTLVFSWRAKLQIKNILVVNSETTYLKIIQLSIPTPAKLLHCLIMTFQKTRELPA